MIKDEMKFRLEKEHKAHIEEIEKKNAEERQFLAQRVFNLEYNFKNPSEHEWRK